MVEPSSSGASRDSHAEELVTGLFRELGWAVEREPAVVAGGPDAIIKKGSRRYAVEIKSVSESRRDRVIPVLSEAILRAQAYARRLPRCQPMAIVALPDVPESLAEQVGQFVGKYAGDVAVGLVGWNAVRRFFGKGLESLNAEAPAVRGGAARRPGRVPNLFSDLNQWMLKVLLAPELPEHLLKAPRGSYRNVSELAAAADVSVMSAFRFAEQLRHEFFLDNESSRHLRLVRREELFRRWQALALRSCPERAMRFLVRGDVHSKLRQIVRDSGGCLGLFAAADALKLGFVSGVPPYIYIARLDDNVLADLRGLVPVLAGESPDVILRQAPAPQSVFRGAVVADEMAVSDVLQVWLDVSEHPARGSEQADLIERRVLEKLIRGAG